MEEVCVEGRDERRSLLDVFAPLALQVLYLVEAAVDTRGEACDAGLLSPPFFASSVRSMEAWTSRRALLIPSTAPPKFQTHCLRLRVRLFVARSSQISSGYVP